MNNKAFIDERSTYDTFVDWLFECGNDLCISWAGIEVLSKAGSDGPDCTKFGLDGIPYKYILHIEEYLIEEEFYEDGGGYEDDYIAPKVHYLDWFNKKFGTNYHNDYL